MPVIWAKRLPQGRAELSVRAQEFRTALAERSMRWQTSARALGQDLLGPVRECCEHSEQLIIVADGPLWELPFQALILDQETNASHPLWQTCVVSFAPSLTLLVQTLTNAPLTQRPRLLAVGDPALGEVHPGRETSTGPESEPDELQPMPDAARQVRALVSLYGADQSDALIGRKPTKTRSSSG